MNNLSKITFEQICLANVKVASFIGLKCTPFQVTNSKVVYDSSIFFSYFKLATLINFFAYSTKLVCDFHGIKISENGELRGALIAKAIFDLYVFLTCSIALLHLFKNTPRLCFLLNLLNIFDSKEPQIGKMNTPLLKIILIQCPSTILSCSVMYGVHQVKAFSVGKHKSLWLLLGDVIYRIYDWWNLTWLLSLSCVVGFSGMFVSYGAIYLAAKALKR